MSRKFAGSLVALAVCTGVLISAPANAQSPTAPTSQDEVSEHHQLQYRMMNEMTQEMTRMTEQMSRGDLSAEDSKKMSEQMRRMAKTMQFMSGLAARPAHNHAQLQKQMDQMRAYMNDMKGNSRMTPGPR